MPNEPEKGVGAVWLDEVLPAPQPGVKRVVNFVCGECNASMPAMEREGHRCRLTARQARKLSLWRRRRAAELAAEKAPRPCDECGKETVPGRGHLCSPPLDSAAQAQARAQAEAIAASLRAVGYRVEKD